MFSGCWITTCDQNACSHPLAAAGKHEHYPLTSLAASQYEFREQAVTEERVFTFTDGGELLVYPIPSGETVPFWSSRSRLETIQRRLPKYRQWQITEMSFADFWKRLDELERERVQVGVNWSGERLVGYNVAVSDLREGLRYWIDRLGKSHLLHSR